jgi:hypothetical protein
MQNWDDAFLTNVMIPFLEHIRDEYRNQESQYLEAGRRLYAEEVKEFQDILHTVNSIQTTIYALSEWRG